MTAPHALAHLQAQWDEQAAADRTVRRARLAMAAPRSVRAGRMAMQLLLLAVALGLLLPAALAALTGTPA